MKKLIIIFSLIFFNKMKPFPEEANIPPIIGQYGYYHSLDKNSLEEKSPHWICALKHKDPTIPKQIVAFHYTLKEARGSLPFIYEHEGVISEIIRKVY